MPQELRAQSVDVGPDPIHFGERQLRLARLGVQHADDDCDVEVFNLFVGQLGEFRGDVLDGRPRHDAGGDLPVVGVAEVRINRGFYWLMPFSFAPTYPSLYTLNVESPAK